jgi:hypothetical protein
MFVNQIDHRQRDLKDPSGEPREAIEGGRRAGLEQPGLMQRFQTFFFIGGDFR